MATRAQRTIADVQAASRAKAWQDLEDAYITLIEERGHCDTPAAYDKWLDRAILHLAEREELRAEGFGPPRLQRLPGLYEGRPLSAPLHADGWEMWQARRREATCRRLGGVGRGCLSCRWRTKGCPLASQWFALFGADVRLPWLIVSRDYGP